MILALELISWRNQKRKAISLSTNLRLYNRLNVSPCGQWGRNSHYNRGPVPPGVVRPPTGSTELTAAQRATIQRRKSRLNFTCASHKKVRFMLYYKCFQLYLSVLEEKKRKESRFPGWFGKCTSFKLPYLNLRAANSCFPELFRGTSPEPMLASHILPLIITVTWTNKRYFNVYLLRHSYWTTWQGFPCFLYRSAWHVCAESPAEWLKWQTLAWSLCLDSFKRAATKLLLQVVWLLKQTVWSGSHIATQESTPKYANNTTMQPYLSFEPWVLLAVLSLYGHIGLYFVYWEKSAPGG